MRLLLVAILLALLGASVWFLLAGWSLHGEVPISGQGYTAMILGILFSVVIGCGLMALVFYSSRRGYDEAAQRASRNERKAP